MILPSHAGVTAIVTRISLRSGAEDDFSRWQAALTRAACEAPGFVSLEIVPVAPQAPDWHVVQRFRDSAALGAWRDGPARAEYLAALAPLLDPDHPADDEAAPDVHDLACVTEVVATRVEPGREPAFRAWAEAAQAAQARFPGYAGTLVQAPLPPQIPYWTALVRFATPAELDAWLASPERRALLRQADPAVATWTSRRLAAPFAGWFPEEGGATPPAWKQTALVLLVLFPVVMLEIRFLSPLTAGLPVAVATFIGNAISVALVSWLLMGLATAALGWWLTPAPQARRRIEFLGACVMLGLYAAEIALFTFLP
ncbi:antibiotic biosynthesis monooxygenase [Methylobacterium sp. SyP6R]|uniref:antibiotic biosynthesis monooxygenase n=1 Tax=Methylobacterium sp. SyP6R TaxID=2718876 RepID=UPI001F280866|nr:antibiotic biosynthesis monooxygenase [Methylobacterium sp. SyP6R]MCF4129162.1 antibiotic biosynthesis monooxygenase [Methylobacterium sp. SyP6R]